METADTVDVIHLQQREHLLADCVSVLSRENDVLKAFRVILKQMCEYMDGDASMVLHLDITNNQGDIVASHEKNPDSQILKQLEHMYLSPIKVAYDHYLEHETMVLEDITMFTGLCGLCCQLSARTKLTKMYGVRLMVEGKVWGSILVFFDEGARSISDEDFKMMETLAHLTEMSIRRDITHGTLAAELGNARSAEKAKRFFFASVSHNLRTPLNVLLGNAELLSLGDLTEEEKRQCLSDIKFGGNQLQYLVEDVLDLSKLETGRMAFYPVACDFESLCKETLRIYRLDAAGEGIELRCEVKPMPQLMIDVRRVRQIMSHFLSNALRYTHEGYIRLKAEFRHETDEYGTLEFSIEDTGVGIDEKHQQLLIRAYEQLDGDQQTQMGGTGLGLTLCRNLAEKMGGNLWFQSRKYEGSTFGVTLPHISYSSEQNDTEQKERLPLKATCGDLVVLLVDDIELNLKILSAMCRKAGVNSIVTAHNGKEAMDMLCKQSFDIVLTDIWMPVMNGVDLAEAIHADDSLRHLPLYAITGDMDFLQADLHSRLFDDIMVKPLHFDQLTEVLHRCCM